MACPPEGMQTMDRMDVSWIVILEMVSSDAHSRGLRRCSTEYSSCHVMMRVVTSSLSYHHLRIAGHADGR